MADARVLPVAVLGFDGCMSSAVTGVLDTLEIANGWAQQLGVPLRFEASVRSAAGGAVRGSGGVVLPSTPLAASARPEVAIVPPILVAVEPALAGNAALVDWLRDAAADGVLLASVCTGAFLLAEAGVLRGRSATTHPLHAALFRRRYGDVDLQPHARLVDQGQVLCAGSTTSFLSLAIHLVGRYAGHEVAVLTAKTMCVDLQQASQLPFFLHVAGKDHGDEAVVALQAWMEADPSRGFRIAELAARAGLSARSVHRRFTGATGMTPVEYLHRLRVEAAKRLLEGSSLSFERITEQVGYADARGFSRLFKARVGLAPRDYRERFGLACTARPVSAPQ